MYKEFFLTPHLYTCSMSNITILKTLATRLAAVVKNKEKITKKGDAGVKATQKLTSRFKTFVKKYFNKVIMSYSGSLENEVGASFVTFFEEDEGEVVINGENRKKLGDPDSRFEVDTLLILGSKVIVVEAKSQFRNDDFEQVEKTLARVKEAYPVFDGPIVGAVGSPSFRNDLRRKCLDKNWYVADLSRRRFKVTAPPQSGAKASLIQEAICCCTI